MFHGWYSVFAPSSDSGCLYQWKKHRDFVFTATLLFVISWKTSRNSFTVDIKQITTPRGHVHVPQLHRTHILTYSHVLCYVCTVYIILCKCSTYMHIMLLPQCQDIWLRVQPCDCGRASGSRIDVCTVVLLFAAGFPSFA